MAAICHHVVEKVARGENASVTSREQAWGRPSWKQQHEPDFFRNITIKKVKGRLFVKMSFVCI